MAIADVQTAFTAGELSPNVYARVDLAKFDTGAALIRNFVVNFRGGVTRRKGTQFIAGVKNYTLGPQTVRLIPFVVATEASYVLEFGDLYIRAYLRGVLVDEVVTPYLAADLALLKYAQSADVMTIVHPSYAPANFTRTSSTTFTYAAIVVGPTIDPPTITNVTATNGGDYFYGYLITAVTLDGKQESLPSNIGVDTSEILDETSNKVVRIEWTAPSQPVLRYNIYKWGPIEKTTEPATIWGFIGSSQATHFVDNNIAPDFTKEPPSWGDPFSGGQFQTINVATGGTGYNGSGGWSAIPYVPLSISGDGTGAAGWATIQQAGGDIVGVYLTTAGKNYTTATITANGQGGTGATFTKTFSDLAPLNPACVAYVQQRQVFGGSNAKPETLVMSQPGDYANFNTTPVALDSDAIVASISSLQVNTIKSMVPVAYGLLVFTTGGSFLVNGGSPGAAITPASLTAQAQASDGANDIPPLAINYDVLYVQNKGNRVRDLAFAWQRQSYTGSDISTLAAHLFDGYQLVEWCWSQEPDKIVWAVRNDGVMLGLTYVPDQEVYAWSRHDTQGEFKSVCTVPEDDVNAVYVIVRRYVPDVSTTTTPAFGKGAVHFDGNTRLVISSLNAADSGQLSYSFWTRIVPVDGSIAPNSDGDFWAGDPEGSFFAWCYTFAGDSLIYAGMGNAAGSVSVGVNSTGPLEWATGWHHILVSEDITVSPNLAKIYIDGVDVTTGFTSPGTTGVAPFLHQPFVIGGDHTSPWMFGDMAEFWWAPGVSLLDGTGAIPTATIEKFRSAAGAPVSLGADGSTPTGTAPAVYLSRNIDEAASVWGVNKGTGGTFATTGALIEALDFFPGNEAGSFCAEAVHFDGATYLENASLTATDNSVASASYWFRVATTLGDMDDYPVFRSDAPSGFIGSDVAGYASSRNGVLTDLGGPAPPPDGTDGHVFVDNVPSSPNPSNTLPNEWYHVLVSADISTSPMTIRMYINGVDSGRTYTRSGAGGTMGWNAKNLVIASNIFFGTTPSLFTGDLAEVWIAPGQSLLDGSGNIPPETIAKFYNNGCPADLGATGSTPTGTAPAVYLSRRHGDLPAAFATNRGTGGAFVTTGTLTAASLNPCSCACPPGWVDYIERFDSDESNCPLDAWYLDAALPLPYTTSTTDLNLTEFNADAGTITLAPCGGSPTLTAGQVVQVGCSLITVVTVVGNGTYLCTVECVEGLDAFLLPDQATGGSVLRNVPTGEWFVYTPATAISGLDHLEGKEVWALADGLVEGPFTVSGGAITLSRPASVVVVGLKFTSQLQTLYLTTEGIFQGSDQGKRKQITGMTVRLDNTKALLGGTDFDHLTPFPETVITDPCQAYTGDSRVLTYPEWDTNGQVVCETSEPLPAQVLGIIVEVTPGDTGR